jgi:hypothetical protein
MSKADIVSVAVILVCALVWAWCIFLPFGPANGGIEEELSIATSAQSYFGALLHAPPLWKFS